MTKYKNFFKSIFLLSAVLLATSNVYAQNDRADKSDSLKLVQFSGVVVASDSLRPLPFVNVYDKKSMRGTTSDYYGYFSFVAQKGDTIAFSSVGYRNSFYVIPDTLEASRYSMIHMMKKDTIQLKEKIVYPWPSREQFADAFVNADIPNSDLKRARSRMSAENMSRIAEGLPVSGSLNYKWQLQQRQTRLYYNGQAPPLNFLNPFAWADFVDSWRDGEFTDDE